MSTRPIPTIFSPASRPMARCAAATAAKAGRIAPRTCCRDLRVSPHDPNVLYAALSPAFSSSDGGIFCSADVGKTWKRFDHGVKVEATMMGIAVHPRDPRQV